MAVAVGMHGPPGWHGDDEAGYRNGVPHLGVGHAILSLTLQVRMQLFQYACFYSFEMFRIWRDGNPANAQTLAFKARVLQDLLGRIALIVGENPMFPKLHELQHASNDLRMFGSLDGIDAGTCACSACWGAVSDIALRVRYV